MTRGRSRNADSAAAILVASRDWLPAVLERLECAQQLVRRRDLSRASALRSSNDSARDRTANHEASANDVEVLPPERDQLAQAKSRFEADQNHRPPFLVRAVHEPLGLLEVEKVELRIRDLQPLEWRKVIELLPLDRE